MLPPSSLLCYALHFSFLTPAPPQFSASRWLPGGAQGVTALTSAMDVGTNLVLVRSSRGL